MRSYGRQHVLGQSRYEEASASRRTRKPYYLSFNNTDLSKRTGRSFRELWRDRTVVIQIVVIIVIIVIIVSIIVGLFFRSCPAVVPKARLLGICGQDAVAWIVYCNYDTFFLSSAII